MVTNGSLMERLKVETLPNHQNAESSPFEQAMFTGRLPRSLYVDMLAQRFAMHAVLEREIRELAKRYPFVGQIIEDRLLQEPNLRADLRFFGVNPDTIVPCEGARRFIRAVEQAAAARPLALLGFYYVFEGSKNGARIISRNILKAYQLVPGPGTLYLDPHGAEQRALWMSFKAAMDAAPIPVAERDAIIDAAKLTFDCVAEVGAEMLARQPLQHDHVTGETDTARAN